MQEFLIAWENGLFFSKFMITILAALPVLLAVLGGIIDRLDDIN